MGRCSRNLTETHQGIKKGPWTQEEDEILIDYITKHGYGNWKSLPERAGLNRCGKSCRLRWCNYLRPDIKRGNFTSEEDQMIIDLHSSLGNKWSMIASRLPGRTDNEIKNYWNTHLRKKLVRSGIDPNTHDVITDYFGFPVNVFTNPADNMVKIQLLRNILQILSTKNPLSGSFTSPFQISPVMMPNLESMNCQTFLDPSRPQKLFTMAVAQLPALQEAWITQQTRTGFFQGWFQWVLLLPKSPQATVTN